MLFIAEINPRRQNGSAELPGHVHFKWVPRFPTLPGDVPGRWQFRCIAQMFHSADQFSTSTGLRTVHTSTEKPIVRCRFGETTEEGMAMFDIGDRGEEATISDKSNSKGQP